VRKGEIMKTLDKSLDYDKFNQSAGNNHRLNIVIITFLGRHGGIQYPAQLSNALSKNHNVTVIIPKHADIKYFADKVNLIRIDAPQDIFRSLIKTFYSPAFRDLMNKIYEVNPDVIHIVVAEHPWSSIYALLLHHNYPIVVTIHDPNPLSTKGITAISLRPIIIVNSKVLMKFSKKIIVHGKKLREYLLEKKVPRSKIKIIAHGDYSFFRQWARNEINTQKSNILLFGRITPYKGVEYLIEAEKLIRDKIPDLTITIAGEGNMKKYKKSIAEKSNIVVLNRFIPDEEVAELFQKTTLVVLPYTHGSQSGVIPIAYAFKKPVVVTDVGSIPEVVEDGKTGFVIPPKNVNALVEAIIKLLQNDELRNEMGEYAYKKMKKELSWVKNAEKTAKIYKEAIENYMNQRNKN
jgi:starch synthase